MREPFAGGADTMFDVATTHLPNADRGFLAVNSASQFSDAQIVLEWVWKEAAATCIAGLKGHGRLALLKYFEEPPAKLYIQVKAAGMLRESIQP